MTKGRSERLGVSEREERPVLLNDDLGRLLPRLGFNEMEKSLTNRFRSMTSRVELGQCEMRFSLVTGTHLAQERTPHNL